MGNDSNIKAAIAWLPLFQPFVAIIVLLIAGKDKFVKFNALQALFLMIAFLIYAIIGVAFSILTIGIGALIFGPLTLLLGLGALILALYMMYKCFKNEKVVLPVIGEYAEKYS